MALAAVGADFVAMHSEFDLTPADAKALARSLAEAAQHREALA